MRPSGRVAFASLAPAAVLTVWAGLLLTWLWNTPANHDVSWLLRATANWLAGARLYVDILEVNPPLIFLFHVPAVALADMLGISPTQAFFAQVTALIAISLWWSDRLVRKAGLAPSRCWLFLLGSAMALSLTHMHEFGQREHFLTILLWPYVTAHLVRESPDSGPGAIARAAFAVPGVLLKPWFVFIPAFLILGRVIAERRWQVACSSSSLVMAGAGIGYVFAVLFLTPDYFERIVPAAMDVYGAYRGEDLAIVLCLKPWLIVLAMVSVGVAATAGLPQRLAYACLAAAGGLVSYAGQWNGFNYHALPLFAFLFLIHLWLAVGAINTRFLSLALLGLLLQGLSVFSLAPYRSGMHDVFAPYLSGPDRARSMVVISADLPPYLPLADLYGTRWDGRFPVQWLIPGAVQGLETADCAGDPGYCDRLRGWIAKAVTLTTKDIIAKRPDLVIFDDHSIFFEPLGTGGIFSMEKLFLADPGFAAALSDYRAVGKAGGQTFWRRIGQ